MHFRVHRIQKAGIILATLFFLHHSTYSQSSFAESYLSKNLASGVNTVEQINNESSVVLFERKIVEFRFENDVFKEYEVIHKKIKVFDSEAQESYSEIYIPLTNVEQVFFIKAKAISPGGIETETDITKIKTVEENGSEYKLLAVEGTQVNGVIEYMYALRKKPSIYRNYYLGGNYRVLESEYWYISPASIAMDHKVCNTDKFTQVDSTFSEYEKNYTLTTFSFKNIPATYYIGSNFPTTPLRNRVESTIRRNRNRSSGINYEYNDFARLEYDAISNDMAACEKDLKKLAAKLALDANLSEREKIIEVETYIKKNYTKVSLADDNSKTLKFLLKNKIGVSDAIIALYAGLFDALGIKYEMGFATDKSYKYVEAGFDNWANLDEWVFYFPNAKTYIMPTNTYSAPGYLGPNYSGTNMIRIKTLKVGDIVSAVADLKEVSAGPENVQQDIITVSFDEEFEPSTKFEYNVKGYTAASMKWFWELTFSEPNVFNQILESLLEGKFKELDTKSITFKFGKNYGADDFTLTVYFTANPEGLIEKAGDNYVFYPGKLFYSSFVNTDIPSDYAYPIQPKENARIEYVMEVPIPEGYKVEIPEESKLNSSINFGNGKILSLSTDYEIIENKVKVKITENQQMGRIDASDVSKLNPFIGTLGKVEKIYFVLTKI